MRASDVTTLTVRMGAHNLKESAREAGVQNHGVKLVVKHKDFTMETLVSIYKIRDSFVVFEKILSKTGNQAQRFAMETLVGKQ